MSISAEEQRITNLVNAATEYLQGCDGEVEIEAYLAKLKAAVPDVSEDEAFGLLQLVTGMAGGEGDAMWGEGEDFGFGGEGFGGSPFAFDME